MTRQRDSRGRFCRVSKPSNSIAPTSNASNSSAVLPRSAAQNETRITATNVNEVSEVDNFRNQLAERDEQLKFAERETTRLRQELALAQTRISTLLTLLNEAGVPYNLDTRDSESTGTAPTPSLATLPPELVLRISELLCADNKGDVHVSKALNLSRTCKSLRNAIAPSLFRKISLNKLEGSDEAERFRSQVSSLARLAGLVRSLVVGFFHTTRSDDHEWQRSKIKYIESCSGLEKIEVDPQSFAESLQPQLWRVLGSHPSIKCIRFSNWHVPKGLLANRFTGILLPKNIETVDLTAHFWDSDFSLRIDWTPLFQALASSRPNFKTLLLGNFALPRLPEYPTVVETIAEINCIGIRAHYWTWLAELWASPHFQPTKVTAEDLGSLRLPESVRELHLERDIGPRDLAAMGLPDGLTKLFIYKVLEQEEDSAEAVWFRRWLETHPELHVTIRSIWGGGPERPRGYWANLPRTTAISWL